MHQDPVVTQTRPTPAPSGANPAQILEGLKEQRSELRNQLERLEDQREEMLQELTTTPDAVKKPLEARIVSVDARIGEIDKAIAEADMAVARASAVPGAIVPEPPEPPRNGPPEEFWVFLMVLTFIFAIPFSIAFARRIWRRGAQVVSNIPAEIYDRFNRIDQAIDSVAVEVERIGEGQRFLTRVVAEQQKAIGGGAAEPVQQAEREGQQVRR
jgi:hypothetical protein